MLIKLDNGTQFDISQYSDCTQITLEQPGCSCYVAATVTKDNIEMSNVIYNNDEYLGLLAAILYARNTLGNPQVSITSTVKNVTPAYTYEETVVDAGKQWLKDNLEGVLPENYNTAFFEAGAEWQKNKTKQNG